jgi:hypothetical protein
VKTWQQIADDLNVDRSMLFHVKSDAGNMSEKAMFRLRQAELYAGINPPNRLPPGCYTQMVEAAISPRPCSTSCGRGVC